MILSARPLGGIYPQVITKTVQRLASANSLALLRILVGKIEKRPNRTGQMAVWVRQILHCHASYLMSVPSLHKEIEGLYQVVNRRVAVLPKLLGLSGRLDLMLSQIAEPSGEWVCVCDSQYTIHHFGGLCLTDDVLCAASPSLSSCSCCLANR